MRKPKYDISKLSAEQLEYVRLMVENAFLPKRERMTESEIAESIGVSRSTLYRWRQSPNFRAFYEETLESHFDGELISVYSKLLEAIKGGNVKAIELYLRRSGKLIDKQEVVNIEEGETAEERRKRLEERLKQLEEAKEDGNEWSAE